VAGAAAGRQDRSCDAPMRIQEAGGDKKADLRDCVEAKILVAAEDGKVAGVDGADGHRKGVVVEAGEEVVQGSIAALDDSHGLDWVEPSRSRVEVASEEIQLGCDTLAPEAAVGKRWEVEVLRGYAMRDQHLASP